jgi:hypothetical protein
METKMTVEDVLKLTVEQLRAIAVPIEQAESIGLPVMHAVRNLNECLRAMEAAKEEAKDGREADAE